MIQVEISGISVSPPYQGYVVILKEMNGLKWLPIFIGAAEAHTISLLLQGMQYVRPLTYDMFNSILEATSAEVKKVEVTELKDNTFYSLIYLETQDGEKTIDARPSDAIALALRTKSPVFVDQSVFDSAGMKGDIAQPESLRSEDQLDDLNQKLKEAVEAENYEEAARLRDLIKEVEEQEDDFPDDENDDFPDLNES